MNNEHRAWAKKILSHYGQEFKAYLVFEDDNFFIMDWKDKNGSGNMATRYIVDKKKGDLIITGDSGDCIASWYNPVTVEKLVGYINSTDYFLGKIECSTHLHTYEWDDVHEDMEDLRKEYLKYLRDGDIEIKDDYRSAEDLDEDEKEDILNEDFDEMLSILEEMNLTDDSTYPSDLIDLFQKYDSDWYESFSNIGQRMSKRIYIWIYGFQEGVEQLRGEKFARRY